MHHFRQTRRTLAALLAASFALGTFAAAPVLATDRGDGLRAAVNAARVDEPEGPMAPVAGTALLDDIAEARADQMRGADELEHDMDYVRHRLDEADVCWNKFGEIIAWRPGGEYAYEHTIGQWLDSTTHRDIMLDPDYAVAGGSWGTAADGGHYSVMIFVRVCSGDSAGPSSLEPRREYTPDRPMRFTPGQHRAYRFDANGKVLDTRTVTLARGRNEESTGRTRVGGRAYLKVSSGTLEGWWVRESPLHYVRGRTERQGYVSRRIQVASGSYRAMRFDELARVTDSVQASFGRDRRFATSARAFINGRPWFKVTSGPFAGYWLRDNRDVRLVR
jgi:uncharacterized protein YkwD